MCNQHVVGLSEIGKHREHYSPQDTNMQLQLSHADTVTFVLMKMLFKERKVFQFSFVGFNFLYLLDVVFGP